MVGNISTLTALDYLAWPGAADPELGRLLSQGINNPDAIWIVSSGGGGGVSLVLIMVSFIGEAIREAFDPANLLPVISERWRPCQAHRTGPLMKTPPVQGTDQEVKHEQ